MMVLIHALAFLNPVCSRRSLSVVPSPLFGPAMDDVIPPSLDIQSGRRTTL
jgi:hypothetical protein